MSVDASAKPAAKLTARGAIFAALLGLLGSLIIWVVTPYNNLVLRSGTIADDYLPPTVITLTLFFVLLINPLLSLFGRRLRLNYRQLAILTATMLIGATVVGMGLHSRLPYMLAQYARYTNEWKDIWERQVRTDLPASLYPSEMSFQGEYAASRYFILRLPSARRGTLAGVPWENWDGPAIAWLGMYLPFWLMLIGLASLVLPQWRRNERIPFPLVRIQQELMETREDGSVLPPMLQRRSFWIAAGVVFLIHFIYGLHAYFPQHVPVIPTSWGLSGLFAEEPLNKMPGYMRSIKVYFLFLAIGYFMPSRIGFSIWFFMLVYAFYQMLGSVYSPPFQPETIEEHRTGAMLAMTASIIWLGRGHWMLVGRSLLRADSDEQKRNRAAFLMFAVGAVGMVLWFMWANVQWYWAVVMVLVAMVYSVIITRIVAETGIPYMGFSEKPMLHIFKVFVPIEWVNHATAWFVGWFGVLVGDSSRMSVAAMAAEAEALDPDATPKGQSRLAMWMVLVLVLGFFVAGGAHLYMSYNHSQSADTNPQQPLNSAGTGRYFPALEGLIQKDNAIEQARQNEEALARGVSEDDLKPVTWSVPQQHSMLGHMTFGAVLAGILQWFCLNMPKWPLHPIGLLIVFLPFTSQIWTSIFLGWLLRVIMVGFGGARLYAGARPVFVGFIVAELFASVFWSVVSAALWWNGMEFKTLTILPS